MNAIRRLPTFILIAIVVLLLWLPFGLKLQGLIEEWGVLGVFSMEGPVWFVGAGSFEAHRMRPFTLLPQAIGYALDPDSFWMWNALLFLSLVVKGAAAAALGTRLTRSKRWGMVFALLILLYPADTMQFAFRSLHINWSLALLLLGSALLMRAQDDPRTNARWAAIGTGMLCIVVAMLMYEVASALIGLPLILLVARDGPRKAWSVLRGSIGPTLGLIVAGAAYCTYVYLVSTEGSTSYQQSLTAGKSPGSILHATGSKLFTVGFLRSLAGGWYDAWRIVGAEFKFPIYLLLIAACFVFFALSRPSAESARSEPQAATPGVIPLSRWLATGALLLALGYLPYLFSGVHLVISQRTFLFAAPGAALMVLCVLIAIFRVARPIFSVALFVLMVLGTAMQLFQLHHYVKISEAQRVLLKAIVENFDGNSIDKTLVVLDYSNQLGHTWFLRDSLQLALSYLYAKPVRAAQICFMPEGNWQVLDELGRSGHCIEDSSSWTFKMAKPLSGHGLAMPLVADRVIPKSAVITLEINIDGTVTQRPVLDAYREQLLSSNEPGAKRYRNILASSWAPFDFSMFRSSAPSASYHWDFGRWWSMEKPIRGSGWREAEWTIQSFHHYAAAWKTAEKSALIFDLAPKDTPYTLTGHFELIVNDAIRSSLRLRINDTDIPYQLNSSGDFFATIPKGILRAGSNRIEFNSAIDESFYGLPARLSWFEVHP